MQEELPLLLRIGQGHVRAKQVHDQAPARLQVPRGAEQGQLLLRLRLQVHQRVERNIDEAKGASQGEVAHIPLHRQHPLRHPRGLRLLLELSEHRRGDVQAGDAVPGAGEGEEAAPGAAGELQDAGPRAPPAVAWANPAYIGRSSR